MSDSTSYPVRGVIWSTWCGKLINVLSFPWRLAPIIPGMARQKLACLLRPDIPAGSIFRAFGSRVYHPGNVNEPVYQKTRTFIVYHKLILQLSITTLWNSDYNVTCFKLQSVYRLRLKFVLFKHIILWHRYNCTVVPWSSCPNFTGTTYPTTSRDL